MHPTIPANGPRKPNRASPRPTWSKGVTSPPVSQRYSMVLYVVHYPTEYDSYRPYSLGAFA